MAVSNYFQTYEATGEQRVLENLVQESIRIHGANFYYLPKTYENPDEILHESTLNSFNEAILIDMYIENVEGFTGERDLMTQVGLVIRDGMTIICSKKTFDEEVIEHTDMGLIRPREGDLVYFPQNERMFTIRYVDNKPDFYPLGTLPSYRLFCELFEYSNENFNTGVPQIDELQTKFSQNILDYALVDENGIMILSDPDDVPILIEHEPLEQDIESDNTELQKHANTFIDISEKDPFEDLEFKPGL